ncbi:ankyrin repeat-containing domain protein [Aspergillus heterothallicus]
MNPAYIAALCGHRMVFQLLVERGGEVTEVALSRLDKLVEAKNGAAVGMLLSRAPGETFEELQGDFARLVKHAARHGDAECLRHVLEYAAQQDTTRQLDYRDLFFSGILNSEESVVRVLIDYCPWTAGEAKGIHYYIYQKAKSAHFDAVTALAEWHRKSAEDDCSILTSALVGAAVGGHVSIAERLIEEGAEVNAMGFVPKDDFGDRTVAECFPLHAAAYHAFDADVCKILLARGADPNAEDPSGMTALLYAAKRAERGASISIIKALVKSGGDVRATTVSRDTPLHLAVQCAPWTNTPSVKETMELRICKAALILLESGADINVKNSDGRTPLHLAKFERIFTWLQKRGADQTISDKDGLLPREYFEAQMEQRSRLLRDWEFNHGRSKVWKDSEWDWSHIRPKRGKTGPSQMRNEEREMKK